MARPFEPMLLTSAKTIPPGDVWRHEPKIDGFRCSLQVDGGRLRVWSRGGHEWSSRLPELSGLCDAGDDLVLDAELTVVTADGRADFELLSNRILRSRINAAPTPPVSAYVFDLLRRDHNDLIAQPWEHRRVALEALDISAATGGRVRTVPYTTDGEALRIAIQETQGEGLCHKLASSRYSPGKRSTAWRKTKFRHSIWLPVIAWRPPTSSKPACLLVVDTEGGIATATAALPVDQRPILAEFVRRYGRRHPTTGTVSIPGDCLEAHIRYTNRTPTNGLLREPAAVDLRHHSSGPGPRQPPPPLTELSDR